MTQASLGRIAALMAPARDLPAVAPVRLRYLICSAPRVGSNLLCALLRQTGLAGDPLEYLNPRYRAAAAGPADLGAYLDELERRRTSPNGVFGIKVHFSHLAAACGGDAVLLKGFLRRFDRCILMHRRDKLAQAISLDIARRTGFWTAEDMDSQAKSGKPPPALPYSPLRIAGALQSVVAEDVGWRKLLAGIEIPRISIVYEDLSAEPAEIARQAFGFLGIEAPPPARSAPVAKQSDARNTENYRRFLAYCGIPQG